MARTQLRSLSHAGLIDVTKNRLGFIGDTPIPHRGPGHLVLHERLDVTSPHPSLPKNGDGWSPVYPVEHPNIISLVSLPLT